MHQTPPVTLRWIDADDIPSLFTSAPFPPRLDRGHLAPLMGSIRAVGCLCPILARPLEGKLQVVCGYRRLVAAQAVSQASLPVMVRELSDEECRRLFEEENRHREPLPLERVPRARSEDRPALCPAVEEAAARRVIDRRTARALALRFPDPAQQAEALERVLTARREADLLAGVSGTQPVDAGLPALSSTEATAAVTAEGTPAAAPTAPLAEEPAVAPGAALSSVKEPARGVVAGPSPGALDEASRDGPDPGMRLLLRRLEACFQEVARTRQVPVETLEEIAFDLIALSPLRHGRDVRGFASGEPESWLSAHSLLVAGLGLHLAECLGWTAGQVKKFTLACLLHDLGMLFVPRECLLVPGPLSAEQRAQVERHPGVGRDLIQASRAWGAQVHLVAQDHHEKWDGSGYPAGRRGKEVDLPARLVGFLDCFAALISRRPHRPPLLYSQALWVLARETERGLHDPTILLHFRSVFTDQPVGSCLCLEDGRVARVVGHDHRSRRTRLRIVGGGDAGGTRESLWIESHALRAREIPPPHTRPSPQPVLQV